jgi:putative membrane protein
MKLKNIIKVYRQDWKRILVNPVAIIILAGLSVLPSLYAWVNIKACWNIYENTDSIPIAVVNNDKDAYIGGKKINIGSDVIGQLKNNHKVKWIFTNTKDADMGLIDSTYYAMIEIPSDFSSKMLTVLSENPQKPQIIYKVDTKANPVASKVTSAASTTLVRQISTEFISTVNETVFDQLNIAGSDASKNKEDILKMKDSIISINRNMDVITNAIQGVNVNSDNLNEYLKSISNTMPAVQSGLESLSKSNSDNQKVLKSVQTSVNKAAENVDLNLNYAQTSNEKIKSLFDSLNDSTHSTNTQKLNTVVPVIKTQLASMNRSIDATIVFLNQYNSYNYNADIDKIINSLNNLKANLTSIRNSLADLQTQLRKMWTSTDQMYDYMDKNFPQFEQDLAALDKDIGNLIPQLEELNKTMNDPNLTQMIGDLKTVQASLGKISETMEKVRKTRTQTDAWFRDLDYTLTDAIWQIDNINSKIDPLVSFLPSQKTANTAKKKQVSDLIECLQKIKPYISNEQDQLTYIQKQLTTMNSISKDRATMVSNDCSNIASQLNKALKQYNGSVKGDVDNIGGNLSVILQDTSGLIDNAKDLTTQIGKMTNTARKGSGLASGFSGSLNYKLNEFKNVIKSLGSKFELVNNNDIVEIIGILQNDPRLMGDYVSNPFDIKEESIYHIPNYGSGMAPIYTSLALWVGCLVLNSILKTKPSYFEGIERLSLHEKYFGKMLLFSTLAVIQSLIVSLGDIFILKIYVVSPPLFILFSVYSSIVFSIITYTLASTLGNVGKALAIVYLILQVAGSGGSYPVQVVPMVFRILQPLFPFTYTLAGLRESIAGPLSSSIMVNLAMLTIFAVIFLLGGYLTVKPLNERIHQFEHNFKMSGLGE